jgi:hypothetical protein
MTKLSILFAGGALALSLVLAAQDGPPAAGQHAQAEHEQHAQASNGAPQGEPAMAAMHAHMQAMREQMARIQGAQDPGERQRLMHEHMQSMHQHMQMMGRTAAEPSRAAACAQDDMTCRLQEMQAQNGAMRQRMGAMQGRMESIEQLMQQMLDHLREHETQDAGERRERRR